MTCYTNNTERRSWV